jgi:flagellar motor switch protein FliN
MMTYLDCWVRAAMALFAQALAGEPQLTDGLPKPMGAGAFGFAVTLSGDQQGRLSVVLDGTLLDAPLFGEGMDQKAGWAEILREVAEAAAGDLLAQSGVKCRVEKFEPIDGESKVSRAFELRAGDRSWSVLVKDDVRAAAKEPKAGGSAQPASVKTGPGTGTEPGTLAEPGTVADRARKRDGPPAMGYSAGIELLFDVELEASLRFGCREMPLGSILDLGPGDVVQLDRHVADPVDLIVGDKIVARGEVVLVNGNFGLRVTEVAAPKKRLESIRCLF